MLRQLALVTLVLLSDAYAVRIGQNATIFDDSVVEDSIELAVVNGS